MWSGAFTNTGPRGCGLQTGGLESGFISLFVFEQIGGILNNGRGSHSLRSILTLLNVNSFSVVSLVDSGSHCNGCIRGLKKGGKIAYSAFKLLELDAILGTNM